MYRAPSADRETTQIKTNQVVVAVGRAPYTEGLLGEDMSLQIEHGRPVVNADFETSEPGIYAIGDVSAKTQLAHVAMAQATYVIENLAGKPHTIRLEAVPNGCLSLCRRAELHLY